jgi:hypothetical protein
MIRRREIPFGCLVLECGFKPGGKIRVEESRGNG